MLSLCEKLKIKNCDITNIISELDDGDPLFTMLNLRPYGLRVIWNDNGNDRTFIHKKDVPAEK